MTLEGIEGLIRPDLIALGGYATHKSPETLEGKTEVPVESIIKLDANENPYGCSPKVRQSLGEYKNWHIYPDAGQTILRQSLQEYTGIDASCIVAANGSGELLNDILCLLLEPGDEVINCIPTFDLYRMRVLVNRGKLVNVDRDEEFGVNVSAVKAAITPRTKLIIISNPNNPSGTLTPKADLLELLDTGRPVLIDEAYYEFCGETVAPLVEQYRNLMVIRTFSKWAALAGLRVGYGIFSPEIAGYLMKIKLPYNINMAALVAVQETLKDIDYQMGRVKAIVTERERLFAELKKLSWLKPYPSQTNFVLCDVLDGRALELQQKLQDKGILVRYFNQPVLKNSIRISVGKPEHTDALIKVLQRLEEKVNG